MLEPRCPMPDPTSTKASDPVARLFKDDGTIPNNPKLPLLVYRGAINLAGTPRPEELIEETFGRNGWGDMWRNGIYRYVHYHSMVHEALGIARGRAKVRFGGENGEEIELGPGDVAVLPAGTGHQCLWATPDLSVVGAYPRAGKYDLCCGGKAENDEAIASIPRVPLPDADPVYGSSGPLRKHWRA
jgi:uncharacterized protein YjlB